MGIVKLYSDGSARGNPEGPGGYGTILQYTDKEAAALSKYFAPDIIEIFKELNGVARKNLELSFNTILKKYGTWENYFQTEYGITPEIRKHLMDRYLE